MQKNKLSDFFEISLSLYGDECEISEYKRGGGMDLLFSFAGDVDGYITIDNLVTTVNHGKGRFDTRLLARGDYTPSLIKDGKIIPLPQIRKTDRGVSLKSPDDGYIRAVSIRERELEAKVKSLEGAVQKLCDSVYGKTIF